MLRDHAPVVIEEFKGLWKRGDADEAPIDHFTDCENVKYIPGGVTVRDGIDPFQDQLTHLGNVLRIYNYTLQTGDTLLVLVEGGDIYHVVSDTVTHGPILSIPAMTDFGFVPIAGRAYITPFNSTAITGGDTNEIGLQNNFLYVYKGDGTAARKAAGPPPSGSALVATFGASGFSDLGLHIFAVVYETDTGFLTALGPEIFAVATSVNEALGYNISNIPVSPDSYVTKRHIVATKAIIDYNGDQDGYQFFFVPEGNIDNNVDTTKDVAFFDIDLLEDASHLIDNFTEIPAGVALATYNGRLILTTEYENISLVRVSHEGEPEAIDQVDGLVVIPLDGTPITNAIEFRDVLYLFKKTQTYAVTDNADLPSTWIPVPIDTGIGTGVHGIATILDSQGVNTDYLAIASYLGVILFNGSYLKPEASFKIATLWLELNRNEFRKIQMVNDTIHQILYMCLPDGRILFADYSEALTPVDVKWGLWSFDLEVSTIAMTQTDKLVLGTFVEEP